MPRETILSIRINNGGRDQIEQIAKDTGSDRSKVARALMAEALARPAIVSAVRGRLKQEDDL